MSKHLHSSVQTPKKSLHFYTNKYIKECLQKYYSYSKYPETTQMHRIGTAWYYVNTIDYFTAVKMNEVQLEHHGRFYKYSIEKENTKFPKYYIQNVNTIFIKFKQLKPNHAFTRNM